MADAVEPSGGPGEERLFIVPTEDELARAAAGRIVGIVRDRAAAIERAGKGPRRIAVALSGGRAEVRACEALAGEPYRKMVPWSLVHVFQVDERWVPPGSEHSNQRKIREALLSRVPIPPENIHLVDTTLPGAPDGAGRYEEEMRRVFPEAAGGYPRFDAVILGIGTDGHTASLFPGAHSLREEAVWATATMGGEPPVFRVTLTLPVLNAAAHAIFVVSGEEKAQILRRVLSEEGAMLPAAQVAPKRGTVTFLADAAAASRLDRR
jgi:6-phosphogluconolactonase